jgi:hypothetical protein
MRRSERRLEFARIGHRPLMRMLVPAALVVLALASTAGAADRPALRFVDFDPLTLRATAFRSHELVRVTVSVNGSRHAKQVRASRVGGFVVRFGQTVTVDRCNGDVWARATGRLGSVAIAKPRPQLLCPPRLRAAG